MSEKLNELKKATMASYLSKAGGRVRSGTKIGLDFEKDAYKDMATVNKHHPNVYNPGFEKDPAKLAAAEKNMNVNFDLAKTFKRDAANRIKGIARAGRLLAKEDTIAEAGKNPYGPGYKLVDKDGKTLPMGHKFMHTSHHEGSKPEHHEITGWQSGEQRGNSSSSGRVAVRVGKGKKAYDTEYFPHVFDMKVVKEDAEQIDESKNTHVIMSHSEQGFWSNKQGWVYDKKSASRFDPNDKYHMPISSKNDAKFVHYKEAPVKFDEEVVNELKTSTLASVATKRYQQAQAALKDKDYGGYVRNKVKSMKAADATTPKSGWSLEDDKKNEEVAPVISAQEKYRQIKEAKIRKGVTRV